MSHHTDILQEVQSEIKDAVVLGKSWGMSEEEIKASLKLCLGDADGGDDDVALQSSSAKNKKVKAEGEGHVLRSVFSWMWWLSKITLLAPVCIVIAVSILYTVIVTCSILSPEVEHVLGKLGSPYVYPTMRAARKLLKPLADQFEVAGFYSADCMVDNPFYLDPLEDCFACEHKTAFKDLTGQSLKRMRRYVDSIEPFVLRGYVKNKMIGLAALQKMYFDEEARFKLGGTLQFETNFDGVSNITEFFYQFNNEDVLNKKKGSGYVSWGTNSVPSAQAIRKVFSRPEFITESAEVSLTKRIYIEGPIAGGHGLPIGGYANAWYVQGSGARKMTLIPHPHCGDECSDISIILQPGDLIFYQDQFWRLHSEPVMTGHPEAPAEKEVSIGFMCSFTG